MVEDVKAEASAERSRREAEAIYLQDAYAKATGCKPCCAQDCGTNCCDDDCSNCCCCQ